jgi:hypothetical protein
VVGLRVGTNVGNIDVFDKYVGDKVGPSVGSGTSEGDELRVGVIVLFASAEAGDIVGSN